MRMTKMFGAALLVLFVMGIINNNEWEIPLKGAEFSNAFKMAERKYNLPVNLLARMAMQESNYDINAVSRAGAVGIMQIIPKYHPGVNPHDPVQSIMYAGKYMRQLKNRYGTWKMALKAYNYGPTNLDDAMREGRNLPVETVNYVSEISSDINI